jgi:uncharacterized membrane protein
MHFRLAGVLPQLAGDAIDNAFATCQKNPRRVFRLIVAGEFMRRRERAAGAPLPESGRPVIPAILTAAGTVAAFGAIYAAHALYGFIDPATAFVALAAAGVRRISYGPFPWRAAMATLTSYAAGAFREV